jgi:predicted transcriptional regulator
MKTMTVTDFGKLIRNLRIDKAVFMGEMAKALGISAAYLSSVETGEKPCSAKVLGKIIDYFNLDDKAAIKLRELSEVSGRVSVRIKTRNATDAELVNSFARKLEVMTEIEKEQMLKYLNKRRNKR